MTISEVSKMFNISIDTLRYYERIKILPPINRKKNGIREFNEMDCNWVYFVKEMRLSGISVETLIKYVELFQQGNETIPARKELLKKEKETLENKVKELQSAQAYLDRKIKNYENNISKCEGLLRRREDI